VTNKATIEQSYRKITTDCRSAVSSSSCSSVSAALTLVASLTEKWLLLVDGADNLETLSGLWPPGCKGNIICTSKNALLGSQQAKGIYEVTRLEMGEAVDLLLAACCIDKTDAKLRTYTAAIVAELGFLGLAIDQAGAYIALGECGIADFLSTLANHYTDLLGHDAHWCAAAFVLAIYTMWELSYAAIASKAATATEQPGQADAHIAVNTLLLLNLLTFFH
jgi:hypothetical protein